MSSTRLRTVFAAAATVSGGASVVVPTGERWVLRHISGINDSTVVDELQLRSDLISGNPPVIRVPLAANGYGQWDGYLEFAAGKTLFARKVQSTSTVLAYFVCSTGPA